MTTPPTPAPAVWQRKDLLSIAELSAAEITQILDTASAFKSVGTREVKKVPALRGRTLVNFFVEPSTRTRTSFELAAFRLSADVINISATTSSLTKGETLKDTARNLEALLADIIVLRHSSAGSAQFLAERLHASVINAGDGAHEHPTQALLDTFTIRDKKGKIAGLHVAIVGDVLFSRVARSNIHALVKLGARVTLCGPPTLVPRSLEALGVGITHDLDALIPEVDVVNLLRIQHERQRKEYFPSLAEYTSFFGLTRQRAERLKPDALIMHPGPINRGVEIDSDIADSGRSVILEQVTNGLATRMAVLFLCAGARGGDKGGFCMQSADLWPFDQPEDCASVTLRRIVEGRKSIFYVTHDAHDHGWQFLDGDPVTMKDMMLIAMREVVKLDPSVCEVADLPPGWIAVRETARSPWIWKPHSKTASPDSDE